MRTLIIFSMICMAISEVVDVETVGLQFSCHQINSGSFFKAPEQKMRSDCKESVVETFNQCSLNCENPECVVNCRNNLKIDVQKCDQSSNRDSIQEIIEYRNILEKMEAKISKLLGKLNFSERTQLSRSSCTQIGRKVSSLISRLSEKEAENQSILRSLTEADETQAFLNAKLELVKYEFEEKKKEIVNEYEKNKETFIAKIRELEATIEDLQTTTSTTTTTTTTAITPSNTHILVLTNKMSESYIISGDGTRKTYPSVDGFSEDFTKESQAAILKNKFYIFGGSSDKKKIAFLDGCGFQELTTKLLYQINDASGALLLNEDEVLLCFDNTSDSKHCEIFDGSASKSTFATNYSHRWGNLGMYNKQPTTVSSYDTSGSKIVETLSKNGWNRIADHPRKYHAHVLIGLPSDNLLMIGGTTTGSANGAVSDIWMLEKNIWRQLGNMKKSAFIDSGLLFGNSIYTFSGSGSGYPIQRVDMDGDTLIRTEVIGSHSKSERVPALFPLTTPDFCV